MSGAKKLVGSMLGLLIAMILLMVTLRLLGKVPVVGAIANDAKNLAQTGAIGGQ